jgi:hypothetical protein
MNIKRPVFTFPLEMPSAVYKDWPMDPADNGFLGEQAYMSKLRSIKGSRSGIAAIYVPIKHRSRYWGVKFLKDTGYGDTIEDQYERQRLGYEHGVAPRALCLITCRFTFPDGKVLELDGFLTEIADREHDSDTYYADSDGGHYTYRDTERERETYRPGTHSDQKGRYTKVWTHYTRRLWMSDEPQSSGYRGSPEFSELHDTLHDLFGRKGTRDLHGANIGRLKNGKLVCIDYGME